MENLIFRKVKLFLILLIIPEGGRWGITLIGAYISKSVNQSVRKFKIFEIFIPLVEGFMADLKTFLNLALPTQYCLDVTK